MKILQCLLLVCCTAMAQDSSPGPVPPVSGPVERSAADLEKLVAPMALYPDPLIAVMLPAAAYPVEIVKAGRFVADTNNLDKLDDQPWDENVKAVARFPPVIQQMDDDLSWTVDLGLAFVQQPLELMDAIQALRAKAHSVGTLQTTPQQVVTVTNAVVERTYESQIVYVTNTIVEITPANPQVIYVPVYNPVIVYYPPPTYVYNPMAPVVAFGVGVAVGAIIANNRCNWYYGGVYYGRGGVVVWGGSRYGRYPYYPPPPHYRPPAYRPPPGYRPPPPGYRPPGYPPPGTRPPATQFPQQWQPDQTRLRQNGSPAASPGTMEARGWSSGNSRPSTQPIAGNRPVPSTGGTTRPSTDAGTRPTTGAVGSRPAAGAGSPPSATQQPARSKPSSTPGTTPSVNQQPTAQRPAADRATPGASTPRPAQGSSQNRAAQGRNSSSGPVLADMNSGAGARDSSNRGAYSRGGRSAAGGGRSSGTR
jgi:hypothetical protein